MEEKIIIQSKRGEFSGYQTLSNVCFAIVGICVVFLLIVLSAEWDDLLYVALCLPELPLVLAIWARILHNNLQYNTMTVTNMRVFGTTNNGVRVDIPVTAVTSSVFNANTRSFTVASSSQTLTVRYIDNYAEIHQELWNFINKSQVDGMLGGTVATAPVTAMPNTAETVSVHEVEDLPSL